MRAQWLIPFILELLCAAGDVDAQQQYPTKPIRFIVPFPPGGSSDVLTRMLGQKLTEAFKQAVLIDIHDAKTNLSALLDRAVAGEEIVIARAGKPLACLMPVTAVASKAACVLAD